ncbi:aminopeptidase [Abyssisolibacter fermentans]|uniref:aminopeptidase n=1 Tax=Abyssisolibacter fermentans TaxID=1766203 RepID=UPI00082B4F82|nr:aminopeptidase [Abyssisolibacter fermentans]
MDSRIAILAKNLVNYSTKVQKGEKVLIRTVGTSTFPLVRALIKEIYKAGGYPYTDIRDSSINREVALGCNEEQMKFKAEMELLNMKNMDVYIGISGTDNMNELSDVDSEKIRIMNKCAKPVLEHRIDHTRWVVLRYPNASMAQAANSSLEGFEDFYFDVCTMDYGKMSKAMDNLVELMSKTDRVHIKGEGTDLTFSIKGIPVIKCAGEVNIPDGEVFTAPVKDSINGVLTYNCPAVYQGFTYENICLEFKDGKIVKATANDTERINKVFDTDEGARYIGEFAIGVNPYVTKPMKDTLFDEKIMGSFHFTPGRAYEEAPNGNNSAIHWDLVCIQTPEYGGGEIYFDDVLIRKDGKFVVPELECLNPENLK